MSDTLRERKKQKSRAHIADTAARLFGEQGYENVSVTDVAAAAEVSPQTIYNYFGTKRDLLLDREAELTTNLVRAIADRDRGQSLVAAVRPVLDAEVRELRGRSRAEAAGDLPTLCTTSAEVRRFALEARDRQADSLAEVISSTADGMPVIAAKALASSISSLVQSFIDLVGARIVAGAPPSVVADEVRTCLMEALDELESRIRL